MSLQLDTHDFQSDIDHINQIPAVTHILEVICSTTGMGFATIARVTNDRWVACAVNDKIEFGLMPGGELPLETTLCHEVKNLRQTIAIDEVKTDELYVNHHTPRLYGLQSYISIPIVLKGDIFFGTLCAIDPNPALVNNAKTISMFNLFAELIAFHLDSIQVLSETQAELQAEQENAELREQFIAILGHDLRNPVAAISNAAQLQLRGNLDERNLKLAKIIYDATRRTRGLIDNILDFASGRLGGGIHLDYSQQQTITESLDQVIIELQLAFPEREVKKNIHISTPVKLDARRIAQLFSNLLGNAITHGDALMPIEVTAKADEGMFELSVANGGKMISKEAKMQLFKPFVRGRIFENAEGLGLGLYIAQEIASAHGGRITVESTEQQTCFRVEIPLS